MRILPGPSGSEAASRGTLAGARDQTHLPEVEEFRELPEGARGCPRCGKPRAEMADTEDSQLLEIDVRAYRRKIRRKRYRATCDCPDLPQTVTAPPVPKLIAKGGYGISLWVCLLLDKYSSFRPTARLVKQFEQVGLSLSPATITEGMERLEPLLEPVYAALLARNPQGTLHQADETRWMVFHAIEGKVGYRWWPWVIRGPDTVVYLIDAHRSHDVPEKHFGEEPTGILVVDRYSAYKAMGQVKLGKLLLAFCWSHVRRDFLEVGKGFRELTDWALAWLRRIRDLYRTNARRREHQPGSVAFGEADAQLRQQLAQMDCQAQEELSEARLRQPCRKALASLKEHWEGLIRFVDHPEVPMDNNASERAGRGPAVARKNYYGSGSLWSVRLAASMFSILATLKHGGINPQTWLTWYFQACADAGGQAPREIEKFLPWNLTAWQRATLQSDGVSVSDLDSS
jgi:transposase